MVSTLTFDDSNASSFCKSSMNHGVSNTKQLIGEERNDAINNKSISNNNNTYYANFSKFALQTTTSEQKHILSYSYKDWNYNQTTIERQSLQVLKHTLKQYGLHVSGNKRELITRLNKYYMQIQYAIRIQRYFRGFLVRESEKMRGPGYKTCSICNNETDFQTMELLTELPRETFFSYKDLSGFVYGFNIFSLLTMFKRNRNFINPYNREDIPFSAIQNIFSLYYKIPILYPYHHHPLVERIEKSDIVSFIDSISSEFCDYSPSLSTFTFDINPPPFSTFDNNEIIVQDEFCISLFERISYLVNGEANPLWFLQLTSNELYRFYNYYYIWWSRSSHLSDELKSEICSITHPFILLNELDEHGTEEYYKSNCLSVIESMIYTGVDEYHCKLGAEQVLAALSIVSRPTRRIWYELFEKWS